MFYSQEKVEHTVKMFAICANNIRAMKPITIWIHLKNSIMSFWQELQITGSLDFNGHSITQRHVTWSGSRCDCIMCLLSSLWMKLTLGVSWCTVDFIGHSEWRHLLHNVEKMTPLRVAACDMRCGIDNCRHMPVFSVSNVHAGGPALIFDLPNTVYFDGLVQDCSNSFVNALESLQSYTKPSIEHQSKHAVSIISITSTYGQHMQGWSKYIGQMKRVGLLRISPHAFDRLWWHVPYGVYFPHRLVDQLHC